LFFVVLVVEEVLQGCCEDQWEIVQEKLDLIFTVCVYCSKNVGKAIKGESHTM
jgi:hypothetical protein